MGKSGFEIDDSDWPIVVMTLRGTLTTEQYEGLFNACESFYARKEPHVGIVDLRDLETVANAAQRRLVAARTKELEQRYGDNGLCNIMILRSAVMRGALTAVEWLRARPKRDLWVATMDEALDAAHSICRDNGIALRKRVPA